MTDKTPKSNLDAGGAQAIEAVRLLHGGFDQATAEQCLRIWDALTPAKQTAYLERVRKIATLKTPPKSASSA